jgi:putative phosphoribosyl transferase
VADQLLCLDTPRQFLAVGQFYENFSPTTDDEVRSRLQASTTTDAKAGGPALDDPEVVFNAAGERLTGRLVTPADARGIVLFAHGSGSSRHSPRNRHVATILNQAGLATFLFDLLTPEEAADRGSVFDVALLAGRLRDATDWVRDWLADLPLGYFGASTGAAAAIHAAAAPDCPVQAIVSRGGRPDLAAGLLPQVRAPTLLIVGSRDAAVLNLNRHAQSRLTCESRLDIVSGATHLFEEPGALDQVARLASEWFTTHLCLPAGAPTTPGTAGPSTSGPRGLGPKSLGSASPASDLGHTGGRSGVQDV